MGGTRRWLGETCSRAFDKTWVRCFAIMSHRRRSSAIRSNSNIAQGNRFRSRSVFTVDTSPSTWSARIVSIAPLLGSCTPLTRSGNMSSVVSVVLCRGGFLAMRSPMAPQSISALSMSSSQRRLGATHALQALTYLLEKDLVHILHAKSRSPECRCKWRSRCSRRLNSAWQCGQESIVCV